MSYLFDDGISIQDSGNLTAFSRLRTADARLVGEWRYMYGSGTSVEQNDKLAGNGYLVADHARNCYLARVSTANNDLVVRQTKQYNSYIAGTSNLAFITFTANQPKTNLVQEIGLFDDYNGFFFRLNGTGAEFVIRKSSNYSTITENVVSQIDWNLDKLDGTKSKYNPSGYLADWSKSQILVLDYQWLGLGRVRVGFSIDGMIQYVHQFTHANQVTEVYINQPSLPCRYSIKNVGTTSSNSELMLICSAVYSEGSDVETGFSRTVSTGNTIHTLTNGTSEQCVLAVKLKNSLLGKPNRSKSKFTNVNVTATQDINYKVVVLPGNTAITSGTWQNVPGYGWNEYSTNITLNPTWKANNEFLVITDDFALGGGGTGTNITTNSATKTLDNRALSIHQNYDSTDSQILAVIATRLTTDSDVRASISWLETK